ncbi:MAG: class I SAM-dependent methyltransferase [Candidatus Methanomethylophilaceae archaeon]|nr:class I SAM-dependent methyltransferase [Candidatus Methanomethylophilaceae archaeon]
MDQKAHWNSVFEKDRSRFGDEPSGFCRFCCEIARMTGYSDLLELGAGQGRDSCFLSAGGLKVTAVDYSKVSCAQLKERFPDLTVLQRDIREGLGLPEDSFDLCYSHMLFTMDFREEELRKVTRELSQIVRGDGMIMFSVRTKYDKCYGLGENLHEDVWEYNGFAVRYFSEDTLNAITDGFEVLRVERFEEEGRDLFGVVLRVLPQDGKQRASHPGSLPDISLVPGPRG